MLAAPLFAAGPQYELSGHLLPARRALILIYGATRPFQAETESDDSGRFRVRNVPAGAYTIAVTIPDRGEARQTAEVGPATADAHRRVLLNLQFKESDFVFEDGLRRRTLRLNVRLDQHKDFTRPRRQLSGSAWTGRGQEKGVSPLRRRFIPKDPLLKRGQSALAETKQHGNAQKDDGLYTCGAGGSTGVQSIRKGLILN